MSNFTPCFMYLAHPGNTLQNSVLLEATKKVAQDQGCPAKIVDSVPGYGCMNKTWLQVECEMETSYGWCKPSFLTETAWTELWGFLQAGVLIMMVWYRREDGPAVPHC